MRRSVALLLVACNSAPSNPTPPEPVRCGEVELPRGESCLAIGVPRDGCATGFRHDGRGGCTPELADCPNGQLAVPGETTCHAVAACKGRFGDAKPGPDTVYVDATTAGGDGSIDKPFATIQAALDAARDGATIAIAAGKYPEALKIRKRVIVQGACAASVELAGAGEFTSVDVTATAELRDVAVSGSGFGIVVTNAKDVILDRVHVHDTKSGGVYVANGGPGASATLRASLVERATGAGATAGSGTLTIERSLIRDTRADTRRDWGYGVRAERFGPPDKPGGPASVTVRASVLERNTTGGALAQGSALIIEASVVRDTAVRPKDNLAGEGVIGLYFQSAAEVSILQSWIARAHTAGVAMYGGKLSIDRTTIEDIGTNGVGALGMGVLARPDIAALGTTELNLGASRIANVRHVGVLIQGATATLTSTIVRDVAANGPFGDGLGIVGHPKGSTIVDASVTATDILVARAARAGITVGGATLVLEGARLACNAIDLDVEPLVARDLPHPFSLEDRGGNECGCETRAKCAAQTENLEPASAP